MMHQPNLIRRFLLSVGLGAAALLSLSFLSHADDRDLEPKEHTKDSLSTVKEKIADQLPGQGAEVQALCKPRAAWCIASMAWSTIRVRHSSVST